MTSLGRFSLMMGIRGVAVSSPGNYNASVNFNTIVSVTRVGLGSTAIIEPK